MSSFLVPNQRQFLVPVIAMAFVVVLSNWAVQFPINEWLTWGAFTYPVVFLVTDLTNRALGPAAARRVAWAGFAVAVLVSLALAPWRIAVASGTAFIVAQLLDIMAFNRLRRMSWWQAPLIGSVLASMVDTALFFWLAFSGTETCSYPPSAGCRPGWQLPEHPVSTRPCRNAPITGRTAHSVVA